MIIFYVYSGCGLCFCWFVFFLWVIVVWDKVLCVLIDRSFIMCIVIIYDVVCVVCFVGLEIICNNDVVVINFIGSWVIVLI